MAREAVHNASFFLSPVNGRFSSHFECAERLLSARVTFWILALEWTVEWLHD